MIRRTVFAGTWYPDDPNELARDLERYLSPKAPLTEKIRCLVSPHAGYMHSGAVAGRGFAALGSAPQQVIALCPNHRDGRRDRPIFAVADHEAWDTPLGPVTLDRALGQAIVDECKDTAFDKVAHMREHAIELQLPFLKWLNKDVKLVAISVGTVEARCLATFAKGLAKVIGDQDILLLASSDMTHFEARSRVLEKDRRALEKVRAFDSAGLLERCAHEDISMCGRGPVAVCLDTCAILGANTVETLCHDTSKPANGQEEGSVVGYAALAIH